MEFHIYYRGSLQAWTKVIAILQIVRIKNLYILFYIYILHILFLKLFYIPKISKFLNGVYTCV